MTVEPEEDIVSKICKPFIVQSHTDFLVFNGKKKKNFRSRSQQEIFRRILNLTLVLSDVPEPES